MWKPEAELRAVVRQQMRLHVTYGDDRWKKTKAMNMK